ncbi:Tn3 family transposase [Streptomyces sp. NPDC002926]
MRTAALTCSAVRPSGKASPPLLDEGWTIEPEDLAHISPYLTEHINRFGEYSTHELGIQSEAYDPKWTWTSPRCGCRCCREAAYSVIVAVRCCCDLCVGVGG